MSESSVCQHGFRILYGIFKHSWATLKKAAMISDPGPMKHGNGKKRNWYSGSLLLQKQMLLLFWKSLVEMKGSHMQPDSFGKELPSLLERMKKIL